MQKMKDNVNALLFSLIADTLAERFTNCRNNASLNNLNITVASIVCLNAKR